MAGNGNSGRKALPLNVHLLRGNPSKKSAAELAGHAPGGTIEPKVAAPACPEFLSADAKQEWKRVVKVLVDLGIVSTIDRAELAVYCQAWSDWKTARKKIADMRGDEGFVEATPSGYKQMSIWMQIANRAEERMRTAGSSFGMNPAARSRVKTGHQAPQGDLFGNDQKDKAAQYF